MKKSRFSFAGRSARLPYICRTATIVVVLILIGVICNLYFNTTSSQNVPKVSSRQRRLIKKVSHLIIRAQETAKSDISTIILPNGSITNKPKTLAECFAMIPLKPGRHKYKSVDEFLAATNDFQIGPYYERFKTRTEDTLGMIASRRKDLPLPPMPPLTISEQDFKKAMKEDVVFLVGEDKSEMRIKALVKEMKKNLLELVDNGMSPSQAIHELEKEHNRLANMHQLFKGEYKRMVRENNPDAETFHGIAQQKLYEVGALCFDLDGQTVYDD